MPGPRPQDLKIEGLAARDPEAARAEFESNLVTIRKQERTANATGLIIALFILAGLVGLFAFSEFRKNEAETEAISHSKIKAEQEKIRSYEIAMDQGDQYLTIRDYENAVAEYSHALYLRPGDSETKSKLARASFSACIDSNIHCDLALRLNGDLLKETGNKIHILRSAEIYSSLGDFDRADLEYKKLENK